MATPRPSLEPPSMRRASAFLEATQRSVELHGDYARPPTTLEQYREFVKRCRGASHIGHLVCTEDGSLAGVINLNEIVRGSFRSAYLGYYAFAPHDRRGYMRAGLLAVLRRAFGRHRLHRVEANIQPDNARSIALVHGLGFRREGYSPRYLKIAGRWRDHERWALTVEDFRQRSG